MILYALHDTKADTWSFPATTHNEATALREFENMAKRPDFPVADIELFKLADYDPNTSAISVDNRLIIKGADYAKS